MPQALHLDQYALTMGQFFWRKRMNDKVSFELFVRRLPPHRGYLVVAGLGTALWALRQMRFTIEDIDFLRSQGLYDEDYLGYLRHLDLSLDVHAMREGTIAFPREPILRVTGPRIEATLVESLLLSIINHQTMVASKAARIVQAAEGRPVWDFSLRRLHGPEASIGVARAAYIAGCAGTATVEAGRILKIPTTGTMAHALVMAYGENREEECFEHVLREYPDNHAILPDTYDTIRGVKRAIRASMAVDIPLKAIRIDSNVKHDAGQAHALLRGAGLGARSWFNNTQIIASNDLDEYEITKLKDVPIDAYGVGTMLGTSADAPHLGGVYKLVQQTREPQWIMKLTEDKQTDPGTHQVYRFPGLGDLITLAYEPEQFARPAGSDDDWQKPVRLIGQVMRDGRLTDPPSSLDDAREWHREQLEMIPEGVRRLEDPDDYEVNRSEALWRRRAMLGDEEAKRSIEARETA